MLNFLHLYFGHLKNSKRTLLIASLGLILALTFVSSTNYFYDNSKKFILENYFESNNQDPNHSDISFALSSSINNYEQSVSELNNQITQSRSEVNLNYFNSTTIYSYLGGTSIQINSSSGSNNNSQTMSIQSTRITELTTGLSSELTKLIKTNSIMKNSKLPELGTSNTEVFALIDITKLHSILPLNINLDNNSEIELYILRGLQLVPVNLSLRVSGIVFIDTSNQMCNGITLCKNMTNIDDYPHLKALFSVPVSDEIDFTLFVQNLGALSQNLISQINQNYGSIDFSQFKFEYSIFFSFDYSKVDPFQASSTIPEINSFMKTLNIKLTSTKIFSGISYSFNTYNNFVALSSAISGFLFSLLLVSLPIIVASILVINYSYGLIQKNVVQNIGIYKTRGSPSSMIFYFQLLDNVLSIVFSIFVALVIGIPIAILNLKTDYLLSFQYPAQSYYILNFESVASLLLLVSIFLIIIVNVRRIRTLSQIEISETENAIEKEEPFWKRHYLDFILFSIGLVMYVTYYVLVSNSVTGLVVGSVILFLSFIFIPAPFALVIGLILIVNRIIPIFLNKIGRILWNRTGNLVAFSFKNVTRHKQTSTRAVLLISALFAFSIVFYTLPFSSAVNNEQSNFYHLGAEGVGKFISGYDKASMQIIQNNFSQYLTAFSPYVFLTTNAYDGNYKLMLVNISSYVNSAYLDFDLGLTNNIRNDFNDLNINNTYRFSNTTNPYMNVILDKASLSYRLATIGSDIVISNFHRNLNLHILDSYDHWPVLGPQSASYSLIGIGDINYYLTTLNGNIGPTLWSFVTEEGVFFNFKTGVNQTQVASWIEGNTSLRNIVLESAQQNQFISGIQQKLEISQTNNGIIMVIAISIIVLIMFSYFQLAERRKEIFTERALGMKLFQSALLFFIETIIMSVTSILLGTGIGYLLIEMLAFVVFNPLQSYPQFQIITPVNFIIYTIELILFCSILVSMIPAYYITKKDISKSFGDT